MDSGNGTSCLRAPTLLTHGMQWHRLLEDEGRAMILKTEWHIEGKAPDGTWHILDRPLGPGFQDLDRLAHRDHVARMLRDMGIERYSHVRLAKYVTTIEIVGEDIKV